MEIEHVNVAALRQLEQQQSSVPVRPSADTIALIQDKLRQKQHLQQHDVAVGPFMPVDSLQDCRTAGQRFGFPLMLKSRVDAYDGRGNAVVKTEEEIAQALSQLRRSADAEQLGLYAEQWVGFEQELAVMVVRGLDGHCAVYPCVSTTQRDNICHTVIAPALVSPAVAAAAQQLALAAVSCLTGPGVYGVEMFLLPSTTCFLAVAVSRLSAAGERDRASASQQRSLQHRGLPHLAVRQPSARRARAAAGLH